jgi:hypothetical protein
VDRPRLKLPVFSGGGDEMNIVKVMATVLIVAGIVALLYGKFSYTKETHDIKLGPLEMSVAEKQTVNVPVWAGVLAIVGGGVLLLYGSKKG